MVNVRTSSLTSLVVVGSRKPTARNVWSMCGQCPRVVAGNCRGSDPVATTIAVMCGDGLTS